MSQVEAFLARARAVIDELVTLKDKVKKEDPEDYQRRKPLAWEAARKLLAELKEMEAQRVQAGLDKIRVLGARVVIKPDPKDTQTESGIFLPDKAQEDKYMGTVVAVGPGMLRDDGTRLPMEVKVGDRVLYSRLAGVPVEVDGEEYLVINEGHIICIFPSEGEKA